ncbi:hypothetical protein B0H17DRAFT_1128463 [Mycena rosella]|uniref:Uncharacterized protein n=1 Tax=Mycena rosella TaxID=1033263 RepID=A0AAD7GQW9_MYCRO|nr:hypothetical protein B0H17DRAFT_1128463 [Mycena rosella]
MVPGAPCLATVSFSQLPLSTIFPFALSPKKSVLSNHPELADSLKMQFSTPIRLSNLSSHLNMRVLDVSSLTSIWEVGSKAHRTALCSDHVLPDKDNNPNVRTLKAARARLL